ncbi:glycosyltransferase family 2 protein [Desulforhopalus sp. 52FAK]
MKIKSVSFVIPTLNEEENILNILESIKNQNLNINITISDIIVVDNGSVDRTIFLAKSWGAKTLTFPELTIGDLRNRGAEVASGEILIFADADNILEENVVNGIVSLFENEDIDALGPDGLLPYGEATWVQKTWYFHTTSCTDINPVQFVDNLSSGFFVIKSNVFKNMSGFNGTLTIGEDSEFSKRLMQSGFKLAKSKQIILYNTGHPRSIKNYFKREFWHGDCIEDLFKHKNIDFLTIYFFSFFFILITFTYSIFSVKPILILVCGAGLIFVPLLKSFQKEKKINTSTLKLFTLYFIYSLARSLSLFKFR